MIISDPEAVRTSRRERVHEGVARAAEAVSVAPVQAAPVEGALALLTDKELKSFELYKGESLSILDGTRLRPLATDEEALALAELRARAKTALKGMDATRKRAVDPLNTQVKCINHEFKRWTGPLDQFFRKSETVLLAWQAKEASRIQREQQDAIRRQEEAAVREAEATERAQAAETPEARQEAMQAAEEASTEIMVAQVETPRDPVKGWKGDLGSTHKTERWSFEVVKPEDVPREYLAVDERLIRAAVCKKDGVREISGVHIFPKDGLSTRTGAS